MKIVVEQAKGMIFLERPRHRGRNIVKPDLKIIFVNILLICTAYNFVMNKFLAQD
jgi:hypothetical protein